MIISFISSHGKAKHQNFTLVHDEVNFYSLSEYLVVAVLAVILFSRLLNDQ